MSYASLSQRWAQKKEKAALMQFQVPLLSEKVPFLDRPSVILGMRELFPIRWNTTLIRDIQRADMGIYSEKSRISGSELN